MSSRPETAPADGIVRSAIELTRFPWIRPLVTAYARDFSSVASLYAGDPADPAAWRDTIARVQSAPRDRETVAAMVGAQLAARRAPAAAVEQAARLAQPDAVAIVTGQQAGAFGGPLYTLLKAVTALQLARRVREAHGVPVVPVFWVDSEDHDWDEVRTASVLDRDFELHGISLPDPDGAGSQPIATLRLPGSVDEAIGQLEQALAPTEFTAEVLATLRRCYQPGASVSGAFAAWIETLLGRHGLVVFDAADRAAKPVVSALFARELDQPCQTAQLATEAGETMAALGHDPQVTPSEDGVALFYLNEAGRHAIRRQDGRYHVADASRTPAEMRDEAVAHPERFSPNVLLRPLVQDRLFPTICYVAGPSELAYQGQLKGIYRAFGVEFPLQYNRGSATILDSGALRFLDRYDVPFEALHAQDESALNRLLEQQLPPTIDEALDATDRDIAARARALREAVVPLDPTLAGAVDTTLERMRETVKTLHGKIIQASKRKDETLRRQFTRTRTLAFPSGAPQERVLSVVFFVNRYGPALCDALLDGLPLETDQHYILRL